MPTATYDPGALFGACSDSRHALGGGLLLGVLAYSCLPRTVDVQVPLHDLAVAATLGPGFGALFATLLYAVVQRTSLRAAALVVLLPLMAWVASVALGLRHPAEVVGLAALCCLGVAAVPAHSSAGFSGMACGLSRAGGLVLLGAILDGAPSGWGLFQEQPPWSPGVAAALLDLSPRTFTMEIAGFDWMRHPSVYESVGTDRISPSMRPPYGHGAMGATAAASTWRRAVAVLPVIVVGSVLTSIRLYRCSKLSANSR